MRRTDALILLRRVDATGLLFRHNMDLDADVANLLAEIDKHQPGLDPADYRAEERQTVSNHDMSEDERLDSPQHGQGDK